MGCEGNETRKRDESEPHVRRASKSPSVTGLAYNRRSSPASHDFACVCAATGPNSLQILFCKLPRYGLKNLVSHTCMILMHNTTFLWEFPGNYLLLHPVIAICHISLQILNKTSDYTTICLYINP